MNAAAPRLLVAAVLTSVAVVPSLPAQTRFAPITESMVTFGRGGGLRSNNNFVAGAVALADIGVRWTQPSGRGYGISLSGGYDFPNEATLLGVRARASRPLGSGRIEGFVALISSSVGDGGLGDPDGMGGSVGLAYWPVSWFSVVGQVEVMPTWPDEDLASDFTPQPTRKAALSLGIRLGGKPALASWMAGAVLGVVAAAADGMSTSIGW